MLIAGLLGAGFAAFFQFAPILAERRGTVSPGALYSVYGAAIVATRLLGGRLLDRLDVGRVVALAAGLMVLGQALLAASSSAVSTAASSAGSLVGGSSSVRVFAPAGDPLVHGSSLLPAFDRFRGLIDAILTGPAPLVVAAILIAAGSGLFHPALLAHHAALLSDAPGRASAAFYIAFDLGIGLGSWLCGAALQVAGLPGLYWTAAGLVAAVLPLAPRLDSGDPEAEACAPPSERRP